MAFKAGSVKEQNDLACIGVIKEVGDTYLSSKANPDGTGPQYQVTKLDIEGSHGGRSGQFYLVFELPWVQPGFDPDTLDGVQNGMYRRTVNDEQRPSVFKMVLGDENFTKLGEELDKLGTVTQADFSDLFRQLAVGNEVGYEMEQRADEESGALLDSFQITRFFPLTEEGLAYEIKQSKNKNRKSHRKPKTLTITWDEN